MKTNLAHAHHDCTKRYHKMPKNLQIVNINALSGNIDGFLRKNFSDHHETSIIFIEREVERQV